MAEKYNKVEFWLFDKGKIATLRTDFVHCKLIFTLTYYYVNIANFALYTPT